MSQAKKLFISYSHTDKEFTKSIVDALEFNRIRVWVDFKELRGGDLISPEIKRATLDCAAMLLVISPESMTSKNVRGEYNEFLHQKPIIPVMCKRTDKELLFFDLSNVLYIDFTFDEIIEDKHKHYQAKLQELLNALKKHEIVPEPLSDSLYMEEEITATISLDSDPEIRGRLTSSLPQLEPTVTLRGHPEYYGAFLLSKYREERSSGITSIQQIGQPQVEKWLNESNPEDMPYFFLPIIDFPEKRS